MTKCISCGANTTEIIVVTFCPPNFVTSWSSFTRWRAACSALLWIGSRRCRGSDRCPMSKSWAGLAWLIWCGQPPSMPAERRGLHCHSSSNCKFSCRIWRRLRQSCSMHDFSVFSSSQSPATRSENALWIRCHHGIATPTHSRTSQPVSSIQFHRCIPLQIRPTQIR